MTLPRHARGLDAGDAEGVIEDAIFDEDVADAAGHFAAHGDAKAAVEAAMGDADVFRRGWPTVAFGIATGFDGDAVVLAGDGAIEDVRRFGRSRDRKAVAVNYAGIAVAGFVVLGGDVYGVEGDVVAIDGMDAPGGGLADGEAVEIEIVGVADADGAAADAG